MPTTPSLPALTLRRDANGYRSSDSRWIVRQEQVLPKLTTFYVEDTLGLTATAPTGVTLSQARTFVKAQYPVPPRVHRVQVGDGYYFAHTPMGTFALDHLIPSPEERAAGHAEKWVMIHPGRPVPDSEAETLGELLENIDSLLAWETNQKGRSLADLCAESWRLEHHDASSSWGQLAKAFDAAVRSGLVKLEEKAEAGL